MPTVTALIFLRILNKRPQIFILYRAFQIMLPILEQYCSETWEGSLVLMWRIWKGILEEVTSALRCEGETIGPTKNSDRENLITSCRWTGQSCNVTGEFHQTIMPPSFFFYVIDFYLLMWMHWVLVVARGIFSCSMWDLVPWPGIVLGSPALGAWSLSHWTTREVPLPPSSS